MWLNVKKHVGNFLFSGVAQGAFVTTVPQIFAFLQPMLAQFVELFGLYHNYQNVTELVLELYGETAKKLLCYLSRSDTRMFYQRSESISTLWS